MDHFTQLHKDEYSTEMKIERKDTMPNTHIIQLPRYTNLEHSETVRQKCNSIEDISEHNKHIFKKLSPWQDQDA